MSIEVPNREAWIASAVDVLRDAVFEPEGITIPQVKVSVGLPHARNQREILCQHFPGTRTADGIPQLFVSPLMSEGPAVLAQLHNCLHKAYGSGSDRPAFGREHIDMIMSVLGTYPHAGLKLPETAKQDTRMLKMQCMSCGYTARATRKWIEKYGAVYCPCKSEHRQMQCKEV